MRRAASSRSAAPSSNSFVIDLRRHHPKGKNAAQRMVAQETDLVAATGSYLSSFTLAVTEVTERAELPMLTLSYSIC